MDYSLQVWRKPGSDETRIYVNGGPLESQDKLYIFASRAGGWDAKLYCPHGPNHIVFAGISGLGSNLYDIGLTLGERALAERGLDHATFNSIVAVLEGTGEAVRHDAALDMQPIDSSAELKERAEWVGPAASGFDASVQRLRDARKALRADDELLAALRALKLSGSRRIGTKAHQLDAQAADDFALRIGVAGLTAAELIQLRGEIK